MGKAASKFFRTERWYQEETMHHAWYITGVLMRLSEKELHFIRTTVSNEGNIDELVKRIKYAFPHIGNKCSHLADDVKMIASNMKRDVIRVARKAYTIAHAWNVTIDDAVEIKNLLSILLLIASDNSTDSEILWFLMIVTGNIATELSKWRKNVWEYIYGDSGIQGGLKKLSDYYQTAGLNQSRRTFNWNPEFLTINAESGIPLICFPF